MCVCPEGYRKVGFTDECEDVNECIDDADGKLCGEGEMEKMLEFHKGIIDSLSSCSPNCCGSLQTRA